MIVIVGFFFFYKKAMQNSQIDIYLPIVKVVYIKSYVIHHIETRPRPGLELTTSGFILSTHYQQN